MYYREPRFLFFFFNDTATTEIYTLSLHDALPIFERAATLLAHGDAPSLEHIAEHNRGSSLIIQSRYEEAAEQDRKSTRLNSSHLVISYAVFCLKKKSQRENAQ